MNSSKPNLSGPRHAPANGATPQNLVILLHGVGADGNDLIGLASHWARYLPDTEFVSPHAPYPYDKAPQGRQWFSIRDFSPEVLLAGARETAPILNQFIDEQLARTGLSDDRLALVGFSQGTMMALFVALRRTQLMTGVIGYSGRIVGMETTADEVQSRPPILLIHGASDDLIATDAMLETVQNLALSEVATQWHICPNLGHGIDQAGLEIGGRFLRDCFAGNVGVSS
jgi:phospholipase/carboxylesterase